MKRASIVAMVLIGSFGLSDAQAADWSDFASAFPVFPCQDGWMACKVDGDVIGPSLKSGEGGVSLISDARVDWFSLTPTNSFSPFSTLSEYTGELPQAAPAPAPMPEPVAAAPSPSPSPSRITEAAPAPSSTVEAAPAPMTRPEPVASNDGGMVRPQAAPAPAPMVRPEPAAPAPSGGMVRPSGVLPAPGPAPAAPAPMVRPAPIGIQVVQQQPAAATSGDDSCDNLLKLEPPAMMGKLSMGQTQCLQSSYSASVKQTDKDRISRLLMTNSYSKGDKRGWEKLVKRHLDEVDQSDPNICYKYAAYLAKKGTSRSQSVIHWAEVALANRSAWTGNTHVSRVYTLYKLKAVAGKGLWEKAEEEFVASPGDATKKKVEDARNMTKVYSREWYEYAKVAGKDVTTALQLCTSAAGTKDYCEAG